LEASETRRVVAQSLDGEYFRVLHLPHSGETGANSFAIYEDGTSAAVSGVAADLGAGEMKLLAKNRG
jgi:hypothetical protein